jgi:hypothetical protein
MALPAQQTETPLTVLQLDREESREFFDRSARELLGISGDEFIRRWDAGDYDEIADDPAHSDVMYLAMLSDLGR